MRDEYPRASDVPGGVGAQKEDRHAREDEGAIDQVEPRPRSIDFDRVAVQIVREPHEDLTGEEPLGKRAARWIVAPITLLPCHVNADGERANPRHACYRASSRGQRDRRRGEPKDKAEKNRKPLHNSLPSLKLPPDTAIVLQAPQFCKARAGLLTCFVRADARTRTGDPFITSEVLYQLSYVGGADPV